MSEHSSGDAAKRDNENLDELRDRLIDQSLRELLGNEVPPDLSARILAEPSATAVGAAAVSDDLSTLPIPAGKSPGRARQWLALAAAASVLFALGIGVGALTPALQPQAQVAYEPTVKMAPPANPIPRNSQTTLVDGSKSMPKIDESLPDEFSKEMPHLGVVPAGSTISRGTGRQMDQKPGSIAEKQFSSGYAIDTNELLGDRGQFLPEVDRPARFKIGGELSLLDRDGDRGRGPGEGGDRYRRIIENAYLDSLLNPLSTFSIDVDTASYANVRQFLLNQGTLPPPDAVRIEELINYFRYDYTDPEDGRPFASHIEVADCPWEPKHKLVRVAIKGREIAAEKRPQANLVFLIDVSGSMNEPNKLPLLVQALKMLTEQLRKDDRVAIVVYAGSSGLVLPSTPGDSKETILAALDNLSAGGSTNGGAGIELAYKVAKENHIAGGINRVILCTDGDFNVGTTSDGQLERLIEEKAKQGTFLTVLGFGRGNFNDSMLEAISGKGNGNYAYVDSPAEARKVLVEQLSGTLMTIAKDVKIQIEFNPAKVAGYRLVGYEDRILAAQDFNDDKKDAGEIGSGHTVTALYEIVPAGEKVPVVAVDALKYQVPAKVTGQGVDELLTLKMRYKEPTADVSQLIEVPVKDASKKFAAASSDFQFAAAVAGFGMLLRDSRYKGNLTYDAVLEIATQHKGNDSSGYRAELLEMIRKAKQLAAK